MVTHWVRAALGSPPSPSSGEAATAWSLSVVTGPEGGLFGFVPFSLGVDLGRSPSAGSWYLGFHATPRYPIAWAS